MASPTCTVDGDPTTDGVDVAGATLVTIQLADLAGARQWSIECINVDPQPDARGAPYTAADIRAPLTVDYTTFTATFTPHPLDGEDYDSGYYQRAPYSEQNPPVSSSNPLDPTWIRVKIVASDGPTNNKVTRSI